MRSPYFHLKINIYNFGRDSNLLHTIKYKNSQPNGAAEGGLIIGTTWAHFVFNYPYIGTSLELLYSIKTLIMKYINTRDKIDKFRSVYQFYTNRRK